MLTNYKGRTQTLNFFSVGDKFFLVDMPGYGYAKPPVKVVREWQQLIWGYLTSRQSLKMTYLLIDARRDELKKSDLKCLEILKQTDIPFTVWRC